MSSVGSRSRTSSLRKDDVLQGIQDLLEEKRYPSEFSHTITSPPHIGGTPYSQSLKDLIINSVSMETTGDQMISSLTGQQATGNDLIIGFKSLVHFLGHETTPHKTEIQQTIVYPLFLVCYITLVLVEEGQSAQSLYKSSSELIDQLCTNSHDLKELMLLTSRDSLTTSSLAEKIRVHKYSCRMSDPAFNLLFSFLQNHPTPCLMNLVQKHFSLEVFGNAVQVSDPKQDTKKAPSFTRPQINPVSELDICLSYAKPKPHPLAPPPQPDTESAAIKADYQHRLMSAAQQLDPSLPSLLLCTVDTHPHQRILSSSLSNQSRVYACSLDDSSIMIQSWLPPSHDDHMTNSTTSTMSCDVLRGHSGPVYGLSFSRSGQYLLSSSEDTSVRLWNTSTSSCEVVFIGHQYPVWDVTFSPVDGYFVSSSYDRTARLWNTEHVYPLRILAGHEESVQAARFHPNGSYIATGSYDRTCRLWDIHTGNSVRVFTGSQQPVVTLAFSPFGKQLASAASNGTITLWDITSARAITELKGHTSNITSLAFSSDGTLLASCGFDRTIKLWNMKAILSTNGSPSFQELISSSSTGTILPLTTSFIQRNCLVAIGTLDHSISSDNRTELNSDQNFMYYN